MTELNSFFVLDFNVLDNAFNVYVDNLINTQGEM